MRALVKDRNRSERGVLKATVGQIALDLAVPCRLEEPLGPHTTMGVGGPAPCFLEPSTAIALSGLMHELSGAAIPFRILGAGSNVLVDDAGVATPVISIMRLDAHVGPEMPGIATDEPPVETFSIADPERSATTVRATASLLLPRLVRVMAAQGLGGFEFLEGIPGSVGGSVRMNAGSGGRWIGDVVEEVETVSPDGAIETIRPSRADFGYRRSFVSERGLIVLSATLRGVEDDPEAIRERIRDSRAYRVATQPLSERSSGCIFKNPEGDSAGALLDRLSLKGSSIGGASVSARHANFIVNRGGTCDDILRLVDSIRETVRRESGVDLELEVIVWRDR
jgi:UDP-N-acetylenolpyruvoylglucosamine reductase